MDQDDQPRRVLTGAGRRSAGGGPGRFEDEGVGGVRGVGGQGVWGTLVLTAGG